MNVEHRTSNVQHRMKKHCRILNDYFILISAVLILVTNIELVRIAHWREAEKNAIVK